MKRDIRGSLGTMLLSGELVSLTIAQFWLPFSVNQFLNSTLQRDLKKWYKHYTKDNFHAIETVDKDDLDEESFEEAI